MSTEKIKATVADELDPEIRDLLNQINTATTSSNSSLSPTGARELSKKTLPVADDPEPVGNILDLKISDEGIPVRLYIPEKEGPLPTIVYFHGGGWVFGDIETYDATCRALTNETNSIVVSVLPERVERGLPERHKTITFSMIWRSVSAVAAA